MYLHLLHLSSTTLNKIIERNKIPCIYDSQMKKKESKNKQFSIPFPNGLREKINTSKFMQSFNMIDTPLRSHYINILSTLLLSTIAIIAISIAFASFELFIITFIFVILLGGTTIFQINKCLEDDVYRLEGICEDIYIPNAKNKDFLSRDYLIMRTEDNKYIKIYNIKRYKVEPDNQITIYFPKNSIRILNDDTYTVNSLYLLSITKRHAS